MKTDLKMIIPSNIASDITIAISVQIIAFRYFLKIVQPYKQMCELIYFDVFT